MEGSDRIRRHPGTLWRSTARGVLLHSPSGAEPVLLTSPGDAVWAALADPVRVDRLVELLAETFATAPDAVASDIGPVLDRLLALGAIEHG